MIQNMISAIVLDFGWCSSINSCDNDSIGYKKVS